MSRRVLAAAAVGDRDALAEVAGSAELVAAAREQRLAPLLGRLVAEAEVEAAPEVARRLADAVRGSAVGHLLVDEMLESARTFCGGVDWCVIKGGELRDRVWARREDRVVGDLDLLVAEDALGSVRDRALASGIADLHPVGPLYARFLAEEAHAWQARDTRSGGVVEVHPRLWGLLPAVAASEVLEGREPGFGTRDSGFGPERTGEVGSQAELELERSSFVGVQPAGAGAGVGVAEPGIPRPRLPDAYLLAAVHAFLDPPPRRLASWLELRRIADRLDDAERQMISERAGRWGIEVLVEAAALAVERWFPQGATLPRPSSSLRALERWALRSAAADELDLARIALARLLSGRPSRMGWLGAWRRVWVHPGLVERATPARWNWPRRRLWSLVRGVG